MRIFFPAFFRVSCRPSFLILFYLPKHLTHKIVMKITGCRWKVLELLKQLQVSKPVYTGGEEEGSCSQRNLNPITLMDTRGGFERLVTFAEGLTKEHVGNIHVCVLR